MTAPKRPTPVSPTILQSALADRDQEPDHELRVSDFERLLAEHLSARFSQRRANRLLRMYGALKHGDEAAPAVRPETLRKDRRALERICAALLPFALLGLLAFEAPDELPEPVLPLSLERQRDLQLRQLEESLQIEPPAEAAGAGIDAEMEALERRLGLARAAVRGDRSPGRRRRPS